MVDALLRSRQRHVAVHHAGIGIHAVCLKIGLPVSSDEPSQPFPIINEIGLRPQIHQPACGRCAGQANHAPDLRPHLPQGFPPLAAVVFKRRKLIDHHHVKGPGDATLLQIIHQPLDVLPIDYIHIRRSL